MFTRGQCQKKIKICMATTRPWVHVRVPLPGRFFSGEQQQVESHSQLTPTTHVMSTPDLAKPWFMKIRGYSSNSHYLILSLVPSQLKSRLAFMNPGATCQLIQQRFRSMISQAVQHQIDVVHHGWIPYLELLAISQSIPPQHNSPSVVDDH